MLTIQQKDNAGNWQDFHREALEAIARDIARTYAFIFPWLSYRVIDAYGRVLYETHQDAIGI